MLSIIFILSLCQLYTRNINFLFTLLEKYALFEIDNDVDSSLKYIK